ncbi:MAG TPA: type II toxin-antitoxin system RelE/ParE family toxin [Archangium sp.]
MARYRVRFARAAVEEPALAEVAKPEAHVRDAVAVLERLPFVGRRAEGAEAQDGTLRELIIPAGRSGYVLLYRVGPRRLVSVLAVRHQLEEQYH